MRNASILVVALEIVEERLCESMNAGDLAKACYSSCSGLQKLFDYAFHCSVSEYITKRRMSCAARELLQSDKSITDVAFDFQYGSPEAFSRAFKRFWGVSPTEFRRTRRFPDLFPRFMIETENGGIIMSRSKPMDISVLYDELRKLGGTFVLSTDLINFMSVNDIYGHAAGDAVLAEAFARIERELPDDMLLFRTGGDEFAVITKLYDATEAEAIAHNITKHNGEPVTFGAHNIPLSIRIGISRIPERSFSYRKALDIMEMAVSKAREASDDIALLTD
jgi:AraC family transcriptional regulator